MCSASRIASLIFFAHCVVAIVSHAFALLIPIGILNIMLINNELDFWTKTVLLGATFFSMMYGVNHVGNSQGFCVLTHAENYYRRLAGLPEAPLRFVPRFYATVKGIFKREQKNRNS